MILKHFESHYLRVSNQQLSWKHKKIDFLEIWPIFYFYPEMNKNVYIFSFNLSLLFPWQPQFSIFSIFQLYFGLKITIYFERPTPRGSVANVHCFYFPTINNMAKYATLVVIL